MELIRDLSYQQLRSRMAQLGVYYKQVINTGSVYRLADLKAILILVQYVIDKYPGMENLLELKSRALKHRFREQ